MRSGVTVEASSSASTWCGCGYSGLPRRSQSARGLACVSSMRESRAARGRRPFRPVSRTLAISVAIAWRGIATLINSTVETPSSSGAPTWTLTVRCELGTIQRRVPS